MDRLLLLIKGSVDLAALMAARSSSRQQAGQHPDHGIQHPVMASAPCKNVIPIIVIATTTIITTMMLDFPAIIFRDDSFLF